MVFSEPSDDDDDDDDDDDSSSELWSDEDTAVFCPVARFVRGLGIVAVAEEPRPEVEGSSELGSEESCGFFLVLVFFLAATVEPLDPRGEGWEVTFLLFWPPRAMECRVREVK